MATQTATAFGQAMTDHAYVPVGRAAPSYRSAASCAFACRKAALGYALNEGEPITIASIEHASSRLA